MHGNEYNQSLMSLLGRKRLTLCHCNTRLPAWHCDLCIWSIHGLIQRKSVEARLVLVMFCALASCQQSELRPGIVQNPFKFYIWQTWSLTFGKNRAPKIDRLYRASGRFLFGSEVFNFQLQCSSLPRYAFQIVLRFNISHEWTVCTFRFTCYTGWSV